MTGIRKRPESLVVGALLAGVGGYLDAYTFVGHRVFANALAAERKDVDGPADGPHHVIVEVARERTHVPIGQSTVKRLDNRTGNRTVFCFYLH